MEGYFEMDFLGAAPTANSNESNSYNLRMRNVYGTYYRQDDGFLSARRPVAGVSPRSRKRA